MLPENVNSATQQDAPSPCMPDHDTTSLSWLLKIMSLLQNAMHPALRRCVFWTCSREASSSNSPKICPQSHGQPRPKPFPFTHVLLSMTPVGMIHGSGGKHRDAATDGRDMEIF